MSINLPVIPSSKSKKKKNVDSSIPKWAVFSLSLTTILIVVAMTKAILPLLFFGLVLAFIWSQATKPVAHFNRELKPSGKQLNLFNPNHIRGKNSIDKIKDKKERSAA
tara:strand:+ start:685 stop:1008 length:324 start_codon:yes stop_codon:yes gene_type:complete